MPAAEERRTSVVGGHLAANAVCAGQARKFSILASGGKLAIRNFDMHRKLLILLTAAPLTWACGDGSGNDESETETSSIETDDAGETGAPSTTPAKGISITSVTASQGTAVTIGQNGEWVDGNGRETRLIRDRNALIRVHHVLEEGWTARLIEARLTLIFPSGEQKVLTQQLEIQTDSNPRFLDRGFYFGLDHEAGFVEPGMSYQIELYEATDGAGSGGQGITVTPPQPELIGFEDVQMEMKVMYVPFTYTPNGTTPDLNEEVQKTLTDLMFEQQPIQTLHAEFHAPVTYSQNISDLGQLLSAVDQVRTQDGAPSNIYYAGIINLGNPSGAFVAGIAPLGGNVSANRIVTSLGYDETAEVIVHETGHNQGLNHIECPGQLQSAGNDSSYPDHPNGRILSTGFGLKSFRIYGSELNYDYMSYCNDRWTSPWTWNKVWGRISQFTAQGDVGEPQRPVLRHAVYADGSEEWWNSYAVLDDADLTGNAEMEFVRDGVVVSTTLAKREILSDGKTEWITAPLPAGQVVEDFDAFRERAAGTERSADLSEIKIIRRRSP